MTPPRSVDEFFAEATRQALGGNASAQDALRQYAGEIAEANRSYFASWAALQRAALRTAFDLQNGMVQTTRTLLDAWSQASLSALDQSSKALRQGQATTTKLVGAAGHVAESTIPTAKP